MTEKADEHERRQADGVGDTEARPEAAARSETAGAEAGPALPDVAPLPTGVNTPDNLVELVQPGEDEEEEELSPRVSTILGPLAPGVTVRQTRDLNDAVHGILVWGLAASTVLLITGLGIEVLGERTLPTEVLPVDEAVRRALTLRASGFLSLGLLVLMATPIVRVIGSAVVFMWERDRRYTLVTLAVIVIMSVSILVGHG